MALGKRVGDDFREGKITLPVVLALARGSAEDKAFWARCMGAEAVDDADLQAAIRRVRETGALDDTVVRARRHGDKALAQLRFLPKGEIADALAATVGFCVARLS